MKEWYRSSEIIAAGAGFLPASVDSFNRLVRERGWRDGTLAREHGEERGGWEYHVSLLPAVVQARLIATQTDVATACRAERSQRSTELWRRYDKLAEKAKEEARTRLAAVQRVDLLANGMTRHLAVTLVAKDAEVSVRTIWNWLKIADEVPASDRLAALAPRYQGRTTPAGCDPRAWSFLCTDYLRPEAPAFEACHRRLMLAAADQGWEPIPSAKTLKRRLEKEIPRVAVVLARRGRDAAQAMYPAQQRDRSVLSAMEAVNADGHRLDVFVRWHDGTVGRAMMTAFQDVYSGMILSHRLDRSENWTAVRLCVADMVESFGIPDHVIFDNGRHFASHWLTSGTTSRYRFKVRDDKPDGILVQLGVQVHFTTPYHGQAKPIERAFRDLCEDIAKHPRCAGAYTGNRPDAKPENYGSRAIPIDEFRILVAEEIARHNLRTGRRSRAAAGGSLAGCFRASLEQRQIPVRRHTDEQLRLLLSAAEGVTARKPSGEIWLGDNRYWDQALSEHIGRRLIIRFDPDELTAGVSVYTMDGRHICDAPCIAATGFLDMDAAREHARLRKLFMRRSREALDLQRELSIREITQLLPASTPDALPPPKVVRMPKSGPATIAHEVWDGAEDFGRAMRAVDGGAVIPFARKDEGGPTV